jgi:hypothetical protein
MIVQTVPARTEVDCRTTLVSRAQRSTKWCAADPES